VSTYSGDIRFARTGPVLAALDPADMDETITRYRAAHARGDSAEAVKIADRLARAGFFRVMEGDATPNPVAAIVGKWPGAETEAELVAGLTPVAPEVERDATGATVRLNLSAEAPRVKRTRPGAKRCTRCKHSKSKHTDAGGGCLAPEEKGSAIMCLCAGFVDGPVPTVAEVEAQLVQDTASASPHAAGLTRDGASGNPNGSSIEPEATYSPEGAWGDYVGSTIAGFMPDAPAPHIHIPAAPRVEGSADLATGPREAARDDGGDTPISETGGPPALCDAAGPGFVVGSVALGVAPEEIDAGPNPARLTTSLPPAAPPSPSEPPSVADGVPVVAPPAATSDPEWIGGLGYAAVVADMITPPLTVREQGAVDDAEAERGREEANEAPATDWTRVLTASRLRTYRRCPREHHFAYERGIRPVENGAALRFGTFVHKSLAAWWGSHGDRLQDALAVFAEAVEADPFDLARARAMMLGYQARWIEEPLEVLAVEREVPVASLRNPDTRAPSRTWKLGGKLDAVARDLRDGLVYIVEHKTTSDDISAGGDYALNIRLDGQVSTYYEGARRLGFEPAGCIYDVMRKPTIRPLEVNSRRAAPETPAEYEARCVEAIAEDPNRFYARFQVVRLNKELEEHARDTWDLARTMRESEIAGRAPKNVDACRRFGGRCSYFSVCCGEASLDDETRFRKVNFVHPELSPEGSTAKEVPSANKP
jgi:hypothetical protein